LDRENPTLRADDREVLHFIAESGGEAAEGEIREWFKLPKTTVWRMSNRLRKERIVDIYKTGGQNVVRIRKKYHKPEGETT
ncbi:MAG: helix-turn-helix transcriptional regulator, partial [Candidatus Bathyarchaeia archaeon]